MKFVQRNIIRLEHYKENTNILSVHFFDWNSGVSVRLTNRNFSSSSFSLFCFQFLTKHKCKLFLFFSVLFSIEIISSFRVDSPNTPTSKMARSLVAQHRWFVTGTPFHRSINDLEGIMQYLFPLNNTPREQIYSLLRNKEKIYHIFLSWLMNFLLSVSRRTSRKCLNDLPEQHGEEFFNRSFFSSCWILISTIFLLERVIRLEFSQLERMYYNRIWQECRDDFKREFEYLWQKHQQKQNCKSMFDEFR